MSWEKHLDSNGTTAELSRSTCILSLVLQKLSANPEDLLIVKSWLSFGSENDSEENFYISFGFGVPFSFYRLSHIKSDKVDMIQTIDAQLYISNIERQNTITTLTGSFASSHVYDIEEHREIIVIQDGQFVLRFESDIPFTNHPENDQTPSNVESSVIQPHFIIVSQSENLNQEGNESVEYSSSENMDITFPGQQQPYQYSPKMFNRRTIRTGRSDAAPTGMPTSSVFRQDDRRELRTGRGPTVPNPAPVENDENDKEIRDSGPKRVRR